MFPQLGLMEMVVVMGVAVILFGKRLPEVGRSLGKGIIEFKKGLRGLEDTFDLSSIDTPPASGRRGSDDHPRASSTAGDPGADLVPKFEPPTAPPVAVPVAVPHMDYQPHDAKD